MTTILGFYYTCLTAALHAWCSRVHYKQPRPELQTVADAIDHTIIARRAIHRLQKNNPQRVFSAINLHGCTRGCSLLANEKKRRSTNLNGLRQAYLLRRFLTFTALSLNMQARLSPYPDQLVRRGRAERGATSLPTHGQAVGFNFPSIKAAQANATTKQRALHAHLKRRGEGV